ncbi:MAG TPA: RDD family protein [Terriglobales bacterium]|nr:RDD family protein [Terriglobales bacterium]
MELSTQDASGSSDAPLVYAGFWRRVAANLIDIVVLWFPFFLMLFIASLAAKLESVWHPKVSPAIFFLNYALVLVIVPLLYFGLMESSTLQATIGKMMLGLRVTDIEGKRVSLGRAAGRTFAKYLSTLTLGFGFVLCGFTGKKQALHDMAAGCLVLRRARLRAELGEPSPRVAK